MMCQDLGKLGHIVYSSHFPQASHEIGDSGRTRTKLRRWKSDLHKQAKRRVRSFHGRKVLWKPLASGLTKKQHGINDRANQCVALRTPTASHRSTAKICKVPIVEI